VDEEDEVQPASCNIHEFKDPKNIKPIHVITKKKTKTTRAMSAFPMEIPYS